MSENQLNSTSAVVDDSLSMRLARKILRPGLAEMTPRVRAWVAMAVTDTVGCILAGMKEQATAIVLSVDGIAAASGDCLIFGTDRRTSALDAALVNGLAAHALDYDDVLDICVIHPSAVLVPTLFALGQRVRSSGREIMIAYVAGLELGVRLALATSPHHRRNGWHPTATLGAFCAVGAAARLLGLEAGQLANAIGLVASQAAGIQANFGSMTKPFHAGQAARSGVLAAQLAAKGFSANPHALEHSSGFLQVYAQGGQARLEDMLQDFASPFDIDIGAIIKEYPCCALTHNVAGMMLALRRQHALSAQHVKRVELLCHPQAMDNLDRPLPTTGLDAKFSNQYIVARALNDGALRLEHFEDAATCQADVRAILTRIQMRRHPAIDASSPHTCAAELILHLVNGERISLSSQKPAFCSFENPMSERQLQQKFSDCAGIALPRERIGALFDRLMSLATQTTLDPLAQQLTVTLAAV